MHYQTLGKSGLKISRLCLGTMNMGSPQWKPWIFDEAQSTPIVKAALDAGVNFIDLADFYSTGVGEEVVGRILKRLVNRDELVIATKVGYPIGPGINNQGHSRKHLLDGIHQSLRRIGTDYVDLFMLHYFDIHTPIEEQMRTLDDIVRAGKARYIGVSSMYAWQFAKMLMVCDRGGYEKPVNMQLQYSLAYREEAREMIPLCLDQGIGISVFSPLARGLLSGEADSIRNKTDFFTQQMFGDATSQNIAHALRKLAQRKGVKPSQLAQAWVLGNEAVSSMLVGADSPAQFQEAADAMAITLSEAECYELERHYTPMDLINDHNTPDKRLPREPRPPLETPPEPGRAPSRPFI